MWRKRFSIEALIAMHCFNLYTMFSILFVEKSVENVDKPSL